MSHGKTHHAFVMAGLRQLRVARTADAAALREKASFFFITYLNSAAF